MSEYIDALHAAIRTREKLTDDELVVEVDLDAELGLVQRALLR